VLRPSDDPNDLAQIQRDAIEDRLDHRMYRAILVEDAEIGRELLTRFT
jgi:hypothetical protein